MENESLCPENRPAVQCVLAFWRTTLQAQNPRGSLRGTVQDATGARIPSAKIVVQCVDSSLSARLPSEDRGEFRIDDLLPGAYHITRDRDRIRARAGRCFDRGQFGARSHGHAEGRGGG